MKDRLMSDSQVPSWSQFLIPGGTADETSYAPIASYSVATLAQPQMERLRPGRHRRTSPPGSPGIAEGMARFTSFGVIGALVFALGLGLQVLLVRRWHFDALASYVVQGIVSVQISFLLNRFWTWRDVNVSFLTALAKFNMQKIITTVANTAIYDGLVASGLNYILSNVATTAIFTIVNYLAADSFVFARTQHDNKAEAGAALTTNGPSVSVVVPCKNNERTILATVTSLLGQDYSGLESVVLVGSIGDSTWQALSDVHDPRLVIIEQPPGPGRRDPNVKRHRGIQHSRSDVIALADSDIVMAPDWLSRGIGIMKQSGKQCVAGGMKSIHSSFWGRFVDSTKMGAKTPRLSAPYVVNRHNFGKYGRKPPVTANVMLTRKLYDACPLDVTWSYGYEDYEWFWRMTRTGYPILFSHELAGKHHHRRALAALCREYLQASDGCARFIRQHPDCPLAIKRRRQAFILPLVALAAGLVALVGISGGAGALVWTAAGILAIAATMREYVKSRTAEALLYLPINLLLGSLFVFGLLKGLTGTGGRQLTSARIAASQGRA
jgi:putative flippase GtrA